LRFAILVAHINLLLDSQLEYFAGAIARARCQILIVSTKLAFEDVVLEMSLNNLHWHVLRLLLLPDEAIADIITSDELLARPRDRDRAEWVFFTIDIELFGHILSEVPYSDTPLVVTKYDFALVRVQTRTVNHNTIIIEVPHVSRCLEIEYFECSVLTGRVKPFIVLLEA